MAVLPEFNDVAIIARPPIAMKHSIATDLFDFADPEALPLFRIQDAPMAITSKNNEYELSAAVVSSGSVTSRM